MRRLGRLASACDTPIGRSERGYLRGIGGGGIRQTRHSPPFTDLRQIAPTIAFRPVIQPLLQGITFADRLTRSRACANVRSDLVGMAQGIKMAREIGKLQPLSVPRLRQPGMYSDGGGLYLQVTEGAADGTDKPAPAKSWIFRFTMHGRTREMGLGSLSTFSLSEARDRARACRQQVADGIDPIEARHADRNAAKLAAARALSFKQACDRYIEAHKPGWRNAKHASQWSASLEAYAYPVFGALPIQDIDVTLVLKAIDPIWETKTETASRVRGRIERVLDWAAVRGLRTGDNPARWRGHLAEALRPQSKVRKVQHHAALPWGEAGAFVATLRLQHGTAARALEFLILTAARTGEAIGARWSEINFDAAVWTVPAERMKAHREHRVPLSAPALAIIKSMHAQRVGKAEHVFPGATAGKSLSNMAMLKLLERMKRDDLTVHGFRSTFIDWASERTSYQREVREAALAHIIPDKTEKAYRHSDLFEKRRRLMTEWGKFCGTTARLSGNVTTIATATA